MTDKPEAPKTKSEEEALRDIVVEATAQELEAKLMAMTDAEVEAELARQGVTPEDRERMAAKEREVLERARSAQAEAREPSKVVALRPRRHLRDFVFAGSGLAAAAAALMVLGLTGTMTIAFGPQPVPIPTLIPTGAGVDAEAPIDQENKAKVLRLRYQGYRDCAIGLWEQCLKDFDGAKELDPEGDKEAPVQVVRFNALRFLGQVPDGGKGRF